jgi:transcriptional regulator with XRE-family HTH domain
MDGPVRLKRWLERREIAQVDFARTVGASRCYVNQWCSGARRPGRDLAVRIQELTRIPVAAWTNRENVK